MKTKVTRESLIAQIKKTQVITGYEAERGHNEYLDELFEPVNICGYTYSASDALSSIDNIAYDESFYLYANDLADEDKDLFDRVYVEGHTDYLIEEHVDEYLGGLGD